MKCSMIRPITQVGADTDGDKNMENSKNKILIVEDDWDIRKGLCIMLGNRGYDVEDAEDGKTALKLMEQNPDLIVLDIMLPDMSGIDVCKKIREQSNAPVLFLTARSGVYDKTEGLNAGGDDYLVKPFFQEELLARVAALLRRYQQYQGQNRGEIRETYFEGGGLRVSDTFNEVTKNGQSIEMPDIEYKILRLLMQYRGKIFSIQNIYESVWEKPYYYDANNTVMVHIRKLRKKVEDDPQMPVLIRTEWGRGYRFMG